MPANQTKEQKGIFSLGGEVPGTPSPEQALAGPNRSITPRGPRFPNLDEAHRNITSRLVPDHPFRRPAGESHSSSDIPLQELSSPASTNLIKSSSIIGGLRRHASDFVSPYPSRFMAGRSLTDRQSIAQLHRKETIPHNETSTTENNNGGDHNVDQEAQHHDITSSTVCRIVDQYATTSSAHVSSSFDGSEFAYTFEPRSQIHGAEPRLGFRGETIRNVTNSSTKVHRDTNSQADLHISGVDAGSLKTSGPTRINSTYPSGNNWVGELDLRKCESFVLAQSSSSSRASSPGTVDGYDAECGGAENGSRYKTRNLIPPPLRVPSNRNQRNCIETPEKYSANYTDSSLGDGHGDVSTGSNDDPFKYDNDYYRHIRLLGREREISCALGRLNHSDTFVQNIVDSPNASPAKKDESANSTQETTNKTAQPPADGTRQRCSFFDPVAFRALHGNILCTQDINVKVVIDKSSKPGDQWPDNVNDSTFGLSVDPENHIQGQSPYGKATDGDWTTEVTSEADLNTVSCNGQLTQGIKETGSSIADYSDDGYGTNFSKFGSQDRILQHSSEGSDGNEIHIRKFTKRSDNRLTHIIRSNITAHGSSRFNPSLTRSTNSQAGMFHPFRRDYKRADASSYFTYKTEGNGRSKYEFRDSTSTYDPVVHHHQAVFGSQGTLPSTSMASINTAKLLDENVDPFTSPEYGFSKGSDADSHKHKRGNSHHLAMIDHPTSAYQGYPSSRVTEPDQSIQQTASDYEEGPPSAISKFSFKLLDISEAQELEKLRRASGETNKTDSTSRYHCSLSKSSTRSNPLPVPSAAYLRRDSHVRKGSRLSSTFTLPPWQTLGGGDGIPGTSEYTTLDASASASRPLTVPPRDVDGETPIAKNKRIFKPNWNRSLNDHRNRLLPVDKRIRSDNSDGRLQSVTNSDMSAVRVAEDHYVSYNAKSRRRCFFYAMIGLSILPFFALLVLNGNFDNSLAWLTHGEIYRLTQKQRRAIKLAFIIECVIYVSLVAAIIAYYVTATKVHH